MNALNNDQNKTRIFIFLLLTFLTWLIAVNCGTGDDTYWHIKVGEWIIANHKVPTTGIFSYTATDFPWVSHEWLSAVLIYALFSIAGWPGLVFMATATITLAMWFLLDFLLKRIDFNKSIIFLLFAVFLLTIHIMPRPHIIALPVMVFWTSRLIGASETQTSPPLPLALLMTLWVNLHGSFIIGIAFIFFFATESLFSVKTRADRIHLLKKWLVFLSLSLAATLITPHGINSFLLPLQAINQSYMLDVIMEWASPNFHQKQPLEFWLLSFMALSLYKGIKLPVFRIIFILGLIHLSLKHVRYTSDLLSFLSPMILATPFSQQLNAPGNFSINQLYPKKLLHWLILGLNLTVLLFYLSTRTVESEKNIQIGKVLTALQKDRDTLGNVLNSYALGAHLIHYDYKVSIDPRTELYGDNFLKKYFTAIHLDKGSEHLQNLIDKYHPSWTFFETDVAINTYLETRSDWKKIYSDRYITFYLIGTKNISDSTKLELQKIKADLPEPDPGEETE
ncbi:MAG: hypothetical protein PHG00_03885 [Methylococcales bacterium]|nr:hypothetical protein [Methylococcales bacterium]